MSLDLILASIPAKTPAQRAVMRRNANRLIETGTARQVAEALRLVEALDQQAEADRADRNSALSRTPMADRVVAAFRARPPTATEERVIRALLNSPGSTSTELSRACGWKGQIWHTHFGTMAKNREADLWPAEPSLTRDADFYCGMLALLDPDGNLFTMKPEVADGFAALGILGNVVPTGPAGDGA